MWNLYEKRDGKWVLVCECRSGDSAKSVAKNRNRDAYRQNLGREYLIRNSVGNNWMKSVDTGSWRMKWVYAEPGENP